MVHRLVIRSPPHLSTLRGTGPNPTKGRLRGMARQTPLQGQSYSWCGERPGPTLLVGLGQRSHIRSPALAGTQYPIPLMFVGLLLPSLCGDASTRPVGICGSGQQPDSTNLSRKRNTPQPHSRAPKPGCRLTTAQRSCCHEVEPIEKSAPSLTLENVLSVARRLWVCRSTIHAWVQKGCFPAPIKLGRSSLWMISEGLMGQAPGTSQEP